MDAYDRMERSTRMLGLFAGLKLGQLWLAKRATMYGSFVVVQLNIQLFESQFTAAIQSTE